MKTAFVSILAGLFLAFGYLGCDSGASETDTKEGTNADLATEEDNVEGTHDTGSLDEDVIEEDDTTGGCTNECTALGTTQCLSQTTFATCGPNQGNCLVWGTPANCPENQVCDMNSGACVANVACQDDCAALGEKSCIDAATVGQCLEGADGCNHVQTVETCNDPKTCDAGECVGGGTANDCMDIMTCVSGCGMNQQCMQACVNDGSVDGQAAFQALQQCGMDACGNETDPAKQSLCILQSCKPQYEGCNGPFGTASCMDMLGCLQGCQNQQCQMDCLATGSYDGVVALMDIQVCLSEKCADCAQNDANCIQQCAMSKCMTEVIACQTGA